MLAYQWFPHLKSSDQLKILSLRLKHINSGFISQRLRFIFLGWIEVDDEECGEIKFAALMDLPSFS